MRFLGLLAFDRSVFIKTSILQQNGSNKSGGLYSLWKTEFQIMIQFTKVKYFYNPILD